MEEGVFVSIRICLYACDTGKSSNRQDSGLCEWRKRQAQVEPLITVRVCVSQPMFIVINSRGNLTVSRKRVRLLVEKMILKHLVVNDPQEIANQLKEVESWSNQVLEAMERFI